MGTSNVRLYVEQPLGQGQSVALTREQAHYLFGVMRLGPGDTLSLFNGRDGEWRAAVAEAGKRAATMAKDRIIVVNLSGRGDKDINTVAELEGIKL